MSFMGLSQVGSYKKRILSLPIGIAVVFFAIK